MAVPRPSPPATYRPGGRGSSSPAAADRRGDEGPAGLYNGGCGAAARCCHDRPAHGDGNGRRQKPVRSDDCCGPLRRAVRRRRRDRAGGRGERAVCRPGAAGAGMPAAAGHAADGGRGHGAHRLRVRPVGAVRHPLDQPVQHRRRRPAGLGDGRARAGRPADGPSEGGQRQLCSGRSASGGRRRSGSANRPPCSTGCRTPSWSASWTAASATGTAGRAAVRLARRRGARPERG